MGLVGLGPNVFVSEHKLTGSPGKQMENIENAHLVCLLNQT